MVRDHALLVWMSCVNPLPIALKEAGGDPSGWVIPDWTVGKDLEFNEREKIAFTFLSITAPGCQILPSKEKQVSFCRQANEYAAGVRAAHPTRYGFFASIPSLLHPAAAHAEIIYALGELQADGIILYTRYGNDNHYLGHPDFRATWDLLDARGAVVFVHPTHPVDTGLVNPSLPQPMIDYPHETTRTACDLIVSGTVRTHPRVKIILSHAGGTLPFLALRPAAMLPYMTAALPPVYGDLAGPELSENFVEDAKSFYFDTALSAAPLQLQLLGEFARPGHVLFGSDFPYAPTPAISKMNQLLDEYKESDGDFVTSINSGAALELFPRLRGLLEVGRGRERPWGPPLTATASL
ncbi:hypothetical protein SLS62_000983 [Diatrype stigma]|uniref:6-methylsalicylate decarboxylase n=1 Tax=Diatrype stigma TaxID=117547 RepID=A0AAN9V220_9PEZI